MDLLVLLAAVLNQRTLAAGIAALVLLVSSACSAPRAGGQAAPAEGRHARNVILFIGDGLGISAYTTTRIWKVGASGHLAIDSLPRTAMCSTYSYDNIITDSAPSATSILSGAKSRNDVIGEASDAEPGDLKDPTTGREGTPVQSILELAAEKGLATGIVTTTTVTHATPASCYAHIRHRDLENDIAAQLLSPRFGNPPPDVILGGGRQFFLPAGSSDPEYPDRPGLRPDGRDLVRELTEKGYEYVWNESQFASIDASGTRRVLGLFEPSHMQFESARAADPAGEPSLVEMTGLAIRVLSRDPEGYFLMVEGGRIDHALHMNNIENAIRETVVFDEAVAKALELTNPDETLIVVTADHSHPLTLGGSALIGRTPGGGEDLVTTRQNLFGPAGKDLSGNEYPTLAFTSGPGGISPRPVIADRPALFPLPVSTHAGEDVFVAAGGPGAERVHGFITNTQIYEVMRAAYGF